MVCSFDVDIAKKYGVETAIIIDLMQRYSWDKETLEGKWTVKLLLRFLPFFHSEKKVRRALAKAVKDGTVLKYSEDRFSRLQLYCLDPLWVSENLH